VRQVKVAILILLAVLARFAAALPLLVLPVDYPITLLVPKQVKTFLPVLEPMLVAALKLLRKSEFN
jgi:hypothetical protein